jgi:voltage-gated sodium channel
VSTTVSALGESAFLGALPRMAYVSLLMFIIFYIYAAMCSFFFEPINPQLWSDVTVSMLTLFRVATFEDWTDVMYETMRVYPLSWIFYISFIFVVAFVFLNMMIGIVVETLQREHEKFVAGEAEDARPGDPGPEDGEARLARVEAKLDRLLERLERAFPEGGDRGGHG